MPKERPITMCFYSNPKNFPGEWACCSVCAVEVFLCNTTLQGMAKHGISRGEFDIYCVECAKPVLRQDVNVPDLSEEQVIEIQQLRGITREQVIQMHDRLKRRISLGLF